MTLMPEQTETVDSTAIIAGRERSNAAIAARNPAEAVAYLAPYASILASTGEQLRGADAMREVFERMFAETRFEALARHTTGVSVDGPRAVEEGRWEARWRGRTASGRYLSRWRKAPDGWSADAELYVTLSVQG